MTDHPKIEIKQYLTEGRLDPSEPVVALDTMWEILSEYAAMSALAEFRRTAADMGIDTPNPETALAGTPLTIRNIAPNPSDPEGRRAAMHLRDAYEEMERGTLRLLAETLQAQLAAGGRKSDFEELLSQLTGDGDDFERIIRRELFGGDDGE